MKLNELALQAPRGTYFGLKPSKATIESILEFIDRYGVPEPIDSDKLHATVVYSRTFCSAQPLGKIDPPWVGNFTQYNLFPRNVEQDPTPMCLVLEFDCPELLARHHELRNVYGASHDFPEFKPHLTLTYNAGDYDHLALPPYQGPHEFDYEYSEPLNTNWVK